MRAARFESVGRMVVRDLPKPIPGPHDLLVKVEACGICGSDRHMFKGEYPTALPVTLGHEFSGIVEKIGSDVQGISVGARISGDPNISCGTCAHCQNRRPNLCAELTPIGVFRDGGFAEYVLVPEAQAAVLPSDINPLHGAFCEPVACCLHGMDIANITPGATVAILGGGVIGLLMVELVKRAGASKIILSTRQAPRRELALELGASQAIDPNATDPVIAVSGPQGFVPGGVDVVIECAGVSETFQQAIGMARAGGAIVVFGVMPKGGMVSLEPFDFLTRELRIESAWLNPYTHDRAAELIASGELSLDALITRTISLSEVPEAVEAAPGFGEIKTMLVP